MPIHPQTRTVIVMLTVPAGWAVLSCQQIEEKYRHDPTILPLLAKETHRMLSEPDVLDAKVIAEKILELDRAGGMS